MMRQGIDNGYKETIWKDLDLLAMKVHYLQLYMNYGQ